MIFMKITGIAAAVVGAVIFSACSVQGVEYSSYSTESLPEYSGKAYVELNGGQPVFDSADMTEESFESYSRLDRFGRCGEAFANLSEETMPEEERKSISHIQPTGWHSVQYDFIEGDSLYNRCHLIGFQLAGENDNELNLITGTRYMNIEGMLPFENMVADYIDNTGNHVLYRVTPVYEDDNLVANGVVMEGYSVEDSGEGICFNVYCYNVQPGVTINYKTGYSYADVTMIDEANAAENSQTEYVLNKKSKKFHYPSCGGAAATAEKNKEEYTGDRQSLLDMGYSPCGKCKP